MSNVLINPYNFQYIAQGVNFDKTNDYLLRGGSLTGAVDGKVGLLSFWFKVNGTTGTRYIYALKSSRFLTLAATGTSAFTIAGSNTAGTTILNMLSTTTFGISSTWHHLLATWDLANAVGQLYIDDVEDRAAGPTLTNDTIDYTQTEAAIGAFTSGSFKWDGCIADLYINIATTMDISVVSNRRKFITANKNPINLGVDGSTPTGTAPLMFFQGTTATWHTNKGTGGGFTENGALTDCATSP